MIDRPHLLSLINQTRCLPSDHPLKRWSATQTILNEDEFELYQWPERSVDSLLRLAVDSPSDPYVHALGYALTIAMRPSSTLPVGATVQEVFDSISAAATMASDELLQLLVANQAFVLSETLDGREAHQFALLTWEQGRRLKDPDPLLVGFYLDALWQNWNSYPRPYAFSHVAVPPARTLVEHLRALAPSRFERLRRFLLLEMSLEESLAEVQASPSSASLSTCLRTRALIYELLELLQSQVEPTQCSERWIDPDSLAGECHDLSMAFFYLEQYSLGLELLRLSMGQGNDEGEIVETIGSTIADLGLVDAAN